MQVRAKHCLERASGAPQNGKNDILNEEGTPAILDNARVSGLSSPNWVLETVERRVTVNVVLSNVRGIKR